MQDPGGEGLSVGAVDDAGRTCLLFWWVGGGRLVMVRVERRNTNRVQS